MKNPRRLMCLGLTSCLLVLTSVGLNRWSILASANDVSANAYVLPYTAEELAIFEAEEAENARILAGGEHYKQLKMFVDYPGVNDPVMVQATDADLPESTEVIGIEVDGQHFAFVLSSMLNPKHHIVNLVLNQNPVSVTYCDLVDCVRVLTDETKVAIPLRVGGFDIDNQMVFCSAIIVMANPRTVCRFETMRSTGQHWGNGQSCIRRPSSILVRNLMDLTLSLSSKPRTQPTRWRSAF